jgi:hypothetical protein
MKNRQTIALLCLIAIGLVAAISANAGLVTSRSMPNNVSELPHAEILLSAPNDLSDLSQTEYVTNPTLTPNEKITVAALISTNTQSRTKERDNRLFINQDVGKTQNFNMAIDFDKLGFWKTLSAYAETIHGTGQANFELRIDPDCNDYPEDVAPVIITEPGPNLLTIPDR